MSECKIPSWDEFFMRHVYLVASKSKDISTKIGSVIVTDNVVISEGYNGFCRKVNDTINERYERPAKYAWTEHGERNAIYNAARNGIRTLNAIMFTNGLPCVDCARAIIQAGIKEVVLHAQWEVHWQEFMREKWTGHDEISSVMFEEAGVSIRYFNELLDIPCLISEKVCRV